MDSVVRENRDLNRFELQISEDELAVAYYRIEGDNLVLIHTEVPYQHTGEGFGKRLADGVFLLLRASGRKATVKCGFMGRYVARHPDVLDLVTG